MKPDFGGYVTRYNVLCSDGNTIRPDAFAHMDGKKVPMVWQHAHGDPNLVLGHAILEHRSGKGLYGRSFLNHTDTANTVREIVKNGDVDSYSIWAKVLKRRGNDVLHGDVKEVSVVLSGANDEARIDYIDLAHSDTEEGAVDAFIFTGGDVVQHDDMEYEDVSDDFGDFLEQYGVKGMKWGVRRSQAQLDRAAGRKAERSERKASRKTAKQEKKWAKSSTSLRKAMEVYDQAAKHMNNTAIPRINNMAKYKGKDMSKPSPLQSEYYAEFEREFESAMKSASRSVLGESPTGRTASVSGDPFTGMHITFHDPKKLKHDDLESNSEEASVEDLTELVYELEVDENGHILGIGDLVEDEEALEHSDNEGETVQDVLNTLNDKQRVAMLHVIRHMSEEDDDFEDDDDEDDIEHADSDTKSETVQDVLDSFTEKQRNAMLYVFSLLVEDDEDEDDDSNESESTEKKDSTESKSTDAKQDEVKHDNLEGDDIMSRNIFDRSDSNDQKTGNTISHSDLRNIIAEAKRTKGSLKDAFLSHADSIAHSEPEQGETDPYGITNIEALFPDARPTSATPELLKRDTTWVTKVMAGVKTTPFSRIKTLVADLTEEDARAKGYLKGTQKKEEVFPLLRRTTTPTTIYKKQKLDRDDIVDITEFDVVVWLKSEMKTMLDEELARAILLGDGREALDPDKIKDPFSDVNGEGIRSILKDNDVYTTVVEVAYDDAEALVDASVRSRRLWKGTGTPTFWTKVSVMGDMLLEKDQLGRRLYETEAQLASAMRVAEIVEVEAMEEYEDVLGIMVNLADYRVGTDRQGEPQFFDDFDIDWNQMKYLYELRKSGALARPKSAVVFVAADVTPGGDEENPGDPGN